MVMNTPCIDHGCKGMGLGYATGWVVINGVRKSTTKHRKVYYEATGEWPEVVRHKCDNPRCINPLHLEGGTHLDNNNDKVARGRAKTLRATGEFSARHKLTDADVEQIRALYVKGSREYGLPALSRMFNIGTSQLHRILTKGHRAGGSQWGILNVAKRDV